MNYQTELMRQILKSERAQEMIDYVSPIYGDSYVGLWLFEVMGQAWDKVWDIFTSLRNETTPITADKLIGMWEDSYGIPHNSSLTLEQRRARLIAWRDRGPCNPHRLAAAVSSALNGVEVEVRENIKKNTFLVVIRNVVYDWTPAVEVLERKKPSHLIYIIAVALLIEARNDIKVGVGMTRRESFTVQINDIVRPITNPEIDVIHDDVMEDEEVVIKEIDFVPAREVKVETSEIEALWDEVFNGGTQ